jgi:hypothetical protein
MTDLPIEQTWLVLVELLTDLRKRGTKIPDEVTQNIRLARTTINFYKADPTNPEMMNELKRINDIQFRILSSILLMKSVQITKMNGLINL